MKTLKKFNSKKDSYNIISLITLIVLLMVNTITVNAQTYFCENFDGPWVITPFGDDHPTAPIGWYQELMITQGDGNPVDHGERDWIQNTWLGTHWLHEPTVDPGLQPGGAHSGTGVAYFEDANMFSLVGSRKLITPYINLSQSNVHSPYIRFYMFFAEPSSKINIRIIATNDGGRDLTWHSLRVIPANFDMPNNPGNFDPTSRWQVINVPIPPSFRTTSTKFGIDVTGSDGVHNLFIDDFCIEEFNPPVIGSAQTGNWNNSSTWVGGVVPTCNNHVVINSGHNVTNNVNIARMQNLTVNGIFGHDANTQHLTDIYGSLHVSPSGRYNSYNGVSGRRTYVGGSVVNAGILDFSVSTSCVLAWVGGDAAGLGNTGTGTITANRIGGLIHANDASVTYHSPVIVSGTVSLYLGDVNPNDNLTLGESGFANRQTIERTSGSSFTDEPIFGSIFLRSVSYLSVLPQILTESMIETGDEIPLVGGIRRVRDALTMNTYDNIELTEEVTVGGASSGVINLVRGIILTTPANQLVLSDQVATPIGVAPSTIAPPVTAGSYIYGPLKINFPSSGSGTINYAVGEGAQYNRPTVSSNVLRTVTVNGDPATPWTNQNITVHIQHVTPTGYSLLMSMMGIRGYRFELNGRDDLPAGATVSLIYGADDLLSGSVSDIRIAQSSGMTGPLWNSVSGASSEGTITSGSRTTVDHLSFSSMKYLAWGKRLAPIISTRLFIEGLFIPPTSDAIGLTRRDTVEVYLRNSTAPFVRVDYSKVLLSDSGIAACPFPNALNGVNYYIEVNHRNSIETWSSSTVSFSENNPNAEWDFTDNISKAYGNNLTRVQQNPSVYAIYGGDVNRDGSVDLSDLSLIYNDAKSFTSGYVSTDLTGDDFVDVTDLLIAYNNSSKFVTVIRP